MYAQKIFEQGIFRSLDFTEQSLNNSSFINYEFKNCNFTLTSLENTKVIRTNY